VKTVKAFGAPTILETVMRRILIGLLVVFTSASISLPSARAQLSDQQIAEIIVRDSRAAYHATGRPCACPDDLARNGSRCGARSAYSRPGGASPLCYAADVTKTQIDQYRSRH
jgi:hypothetical protein